MVVDQHDSKTGRLNLYPRYYFLVTNWTEDERTAKQLFAHYRRRGTFEDRLPKGKEEGRIGWATGG